MTDASRGEATRPRRPGDAEIHRRLVEAATALFRQAGVRAASVDDILAAADLSKPTFYRHFRSKDELVLACLAEECGRTLQEVAQAADISDPIARVRAVAAYFVKQFASVPHRGLFALNLAVEFPDGDGPIGEAAREATSALVAALCDHVGPTHPSGVEIIGPSLTLAMFGASAAVQAGAPSAALDLTTTVEAIIAATHKVGGQ